MPLGRLCDHTNKAVDGRARLWTGLTPVIIKKRREDPNSIFSSTSMICILAHCIKKQKHQQYLRISRSLSISLTDFVVHKFPMMSDEILLSCFRFRRQDILKLVPAIGWPENWSRTRRNRYSVSPLLVTCVVLRRLASPTRWADLELLFGLHKSHLSEIFWEGVLHFVAQRVDLVMGDIRSEFWSSRYAMYADAVRSKSGALDNVVGFIDGTNLKIARPGGDPILQRVAYNGHKRTHAIKFQSVTTPCGLAMHVAGPMEGRRHDWTLYISSGLDGTLQQVLTHDGIQYVLYGDSGYSARLFLYIPFSGSNLSAEESAFNTAMSISRVTVEWYFREVKQYWTLLDFKRKLRVRESAVCALYIAGVLLTNFRNCIYPNSISQYFECSPPSLADYINHRE